MRFEDLPLIEPLLRALATQGYEEPTPIQAQAIGPLLEGRDMLGCAQTGTGKTAAFALPILQRLSEVDHTKAGKRPIRALVLTPTRELAQQVAQSFVDYGQHVRKLRHTLVHGGVRQRPQVRALKEGVDILVATPGRLLDLMGQGYIKLSQVGIFVLDEADRMLDMGFIDDIRKVVRALPTERQTMLFSATMPHSIQSLADSILTDPVDIRIAPEAPAAENIDHEAYLVERTKKLALLQKLLTETEYERTLVFMKTKRGADRITRHLKYTNIRVEAIHADRSQKEREKALANFKSGKTRVLVASDIAARGIDIEDVSHVINYDMPPEAETYVHRSGRTARAGATGKALSFCALDERPYLEAIEKLIGQSIPRVEDHPFATVAAAKADKPPQKRTARGRLGRVRRAGRRRL